MYHVIEKLIEDKKRKEYIQALSQIDRWNNYGYMEELRSRADIADFGDYFNFIMDDYGLTLDDIEWKNHYNSMYCNKINPNKVFWYILNENSDKINNFRVFKFLIKKHGLSWEYMFNLTNDDYLEIQDNYFPNYVNTRLYDIKEMVEDQFYDTLDFLKSEADSAYTYFWSSDYYEGSQEDYLEYLQDLEISDLEDMYIDLVEDI